MPGLSAVYHEARSGVSELVSSASEQDLERDVPATPGWTVKDMVAHLVGDAECVLRGDYPAVFFSNFGSPDGIEWLNRWTAGHIERGRDRSVGDLLEEWDEVSARLYPLLDNERAWPDGVPPLASGVMVTDAAVHLHDVFGAFGIQRDREGAPVKVASAGYISMVDALLQGRGGGTLTFDLGHKERVAGRGEPEATVSASRFELFRALSGRRSPDQIRAFGWAGDPEPFLQYFYPYGLRPQPLFE